MSTLVKNIKVADGKAVLNCVNFTFSNSFKSVLADRIKAQTQWKATSCESTRKLNVSLTPALLVSRTEKWGCAYVLVMDVKRVFMETMLFSGVLFNEEHKHMDNQVSQTLYIESLWQTGLIIKGCVNSDWTLSIWSRGTI